MAKRLDGEMAWRAQLHGKRWLPMLACVMAVVCSPAAWAEPAPAEPTVDTVPAAGGKTTSTLRCTWVSCLGRAMRRSPLLAAAAMNLDAYEAKVREARTAAYPKFDASAFFSVLPAVREGSDGSNPFTDFDFSSVGPLALGSFSVAQPLWTFGKIDNLRRLANVGIGIGTATRRIAEDEMRYQLARAFWGLVMVRELEDMISDGRKLLDEQRERVNKMRDDNDEHFNQSDLLRLQILTADFEEKARSVERSRQQALDGMRLAMNDPTSQMIIPLAEFKAIEFPIMPIDAYETLALLNQPRLLAQRDGTRARLVQVDLARSQLYPDLVLVARIAGTYAPERNTSPDSLATNPNNTATSGAGVALRWTIDYFRSLVKVDQAEIDYRQQVLQEKGEREKARMDVRQLVRELIDAKAIVDVQGKAMKAARGWLNAENQRYEDGFADDMIELQRALESYSLRRVAYLQAIYNYNVAVAALSRAVGMDVAEVEKRAVSQSSDLPQAATASE